MVWQVGDLRSGGSGTCGQAGRSSRSDSYSVASPLRALTMYVLTSSETEKMPVPSDRSDVAE